MQTYQVFEPQTCLLGQEFGVKGLPLVREVGQCPGEWNPWDEMLPHQRVQARFSRGSYSAFTGQSKSNLRKGRECWKAGIRA